MTTIHRRSLAALLGLALVPAALTACTGGADEETVSATPSAESTAPEDTAAEDTVEAGGSVEEQCATVSTSILEATSGMGDLSTMMAEQDMDGITELIGEIDTALAEAGNQITDADLKTTYDEFAGHFNTIASHMEEVAADPTSAEAQAAVAEMTEAQTQLTESATALQEICG